MNDPILSVIIPAYNAAAYIGATLGSVLDKTRNEHEVIVVDDGSTDATPDILANFGSRIRTIRQPNQGLSAARNCGIAAAAGKWLAFLDADDLWLPDFAVTMLRAATTARHEIGIICCGWRYADYDGKEIGLSFVPLGDFSTIQFLKGNAFPVHASLSRRSCAVEIGAFDTNLSGAEDWDFWLRMVEAGARVQVVDEALVLYRQVPGSMSRNVYSHRDNGMAVLDKFFARVDLPPTIYGVKEEAYGNVQLWAGAGLCLAGQHDVGMHEFVRALADYPVLIKRPATYYAIVCADQPLAFKGSEQELDLQSGMIRLMEVLHQAFELLQPDEQTLRKLAFATAYVVEGDFASRQGQLFRTLGCAWRAILKCHDLPTLKSAYRLCLVALARSARRFRQKFALPIT